MSWTRHSHRILDGKYVEVGVWIRLLYAHHSPGLDTPINNIRTWVGGWRINTYCTYVDTGAAAARRGPREMSSTYPGRFSRASEQAMSDSSTPTPLPTLLTPACRPAPAAAAPPGLRAPRSSHKWQPALCRPSFRGRAVMRAVPKILIISLQRVGKFR